MRKGIAIITAVILLASLTACTKKPGTSSSLPGTSTPNTSTPGTSTPGTSAPETSAPTSTPETSAPAATYKDGTYSAEEKGYAGQIKVDVTVKDKKISEVKIASHTETEGVGTKAIDQLPAKIVTANSAEVDSISGATVTSDAIKKAVAKALSDASNK